MDVVGGPRTAGQHFGRASDTQRALWSTRGRAFALWSRPRSIRLVFRHSSSHATIRATTASQSGHRLIIARDGNKPEWCGESRQKGERERERQAKENCRNSSSSSISSSGSALVTARWRRRMISASKHVTTSLKTSTWNWCADDNLFTSSADFRPFPSPPRPDMT